ncbi:MAG: manganese efflux pump MntP family protein [Eubacterium sp.]
MGFLDVLLIGIGLSMDAFAVSICKGLNMKTINIKHCGVIALFFGGFQAGMPLIGWLLGMQFQKYIESFDHWVAFGLLVFIGGNMIRETLIGGDEDEIVEEDSLDIKELILMAIATSIDALAVGIAFASVGDGLKLGIGMSVAIIGITTFVLSIIGVVVGNIFGSKYKSRAEIAGGIILILIGVKILLEHLGVM